jgi:hypothetical protein
LRADGKLTTIASQHVPIAASEIFSFFRFEQREELFQKPLASETLHRTSSGVACQALPQLGIVDEPAQRVREFRGPLGLYQEPVRLVFYDFGQAATASGDYR